MAIAGMRQTVLDAGARAADLFVIAAANVQKLLSTREKATGSGFIWSGGTIDGIPARASKHVPDGTLILGFAGQLVIASWGPGPVFATSQCPGSTPRMSTFVCWYTLMSLCCNRARSLLRRL